MRKQQSATWDHSTRAPDQFSWKRSRLGNTEIITDQRRPRRLNAMWHPNWTLEQNKDISGTTSEI